MTNSSLEKNFWGPTQIQRRLDFSLIASGYTGPSIHLFLGAMRKPQSVWPPIQATFQTLKWWVVLYLARYVSISYRQLLILNTDQHYTTIIIDRNYQSYRLAESNIIPTPIGRDRLFQANYLGYFLASQEARSDSLAFNSLRSWHYTVHTDTHIYTKPIAIYNCHFGGNQTRTWA